MEIFDEEILNLWRLLNQNEVKYIIVGGFAVNLYGFSRFTGDLDIWIKDDAENRKRLRKTAEQAGIGDIKEIETIDFIPGWSSLNLPSGFDLDIMTFIKGFPQKRFDECFRQATMAEIGGTSVRFFDINQLIEAKKASGRPQDLIDSEELERIKKMNQK